MRKILLTLLLGGALIAASAMASAHTSIGVGVTFGVPGPVYVAPPPVAYYPRPYVAPPPVYYAPPPYYAPAPVYYGPPVVYRRPPYPRYHYRRW